MHRNNLRNVDDSIGFLVDGSDLTSVCSMDWDSSPCIILSTGEPESLFGSAVDAFYDYPWVYTNPDQVYVAVAAERSNLGSRLGGSVYIFEFE